MHPGKRKNARKGRNEGIFARAFFVGANYCLERFVLRGGGKAEERWGKRLIIKVIRVPPK